MIPIEFLVDGETEIRLRVAAEMEGRDPAMQARVLLMKALDTYREYNPKNPPRPPRLETEKPDAKAKGKPEPKGTNGAGTQTPPATVLGGVSG